MFDITFILMLILMGKGYTITRGKLRTTTWIKIIVFMFFYVLAYIVLFLVEAAVRNISISTRFKVSSEIQLLVRTRGWKVLG